LPLWLMTLHLFTFMIYLTTQSLARTVQIRLLALLVNIELHRTGRKVPFSSCITIPQFTWRN
jgi:hypothetical protein